MVGNIVPDPAGVPVSAPDFDTKSYALQPALDSSNAQYALSGSRSSMTTWR